jgi:uncharacterized protein YbjT (DUF2867 family)
VFLSPQPAKDLPTAVLVTSSSSTTMPSHRYSLQLVVLVFFLISTQAMSSSSSSRPLRVFVSGAGGQTGQHVFRKLLALDGIEPIGAVRTEESKAALLQSGDVPESSVVICDITDPQSCAKAMSGGVDAAMICSSAKPAPSGATTAEGRPVFAFPNGQPELVDWIGQKNQIDAARAQGGPNTHVILCSSMGGTNPQHPLNNLGKEMLPDGTTTGGDILKWKRKAEVYLKESGLPFTIIHPGGLLNEPGGLRELCLGVDDKNTLTENNSVPRQDVAEVMVQALLIKDYRFRAFDLLSKKEGDGVVTTDFAALLAALDGKNCDYSLGEVAQP